MAGLILVLLACACRAQPAPASATQAPGSIAVIGQVIDQVMARGPNGTSFLPMHAGSAVSAGSQLRTGGSSLARLDFPDGSYLRLAPNSDMALDSGPAETGLPMMRARLFTGKVWAMLSDGTLQVYSPAGVVVLSGQRASVEYIPGDARQASRVTLVVECLEAQCSVETETARHELVSGEQLHVSADGSQDVRAPLPENALRDFLAQNPEAPEPQATALVAATTAATSSATPRIVASTAAPAASATAMPATATAPAPSSTAPFAHSPTAPAVLATVTLPAPTARPVEVSPTAGTALPPGILGLHVVRDGETLYCIARAYRVPPQAIVTTNALADAGALSIGQVLEIPAVPWPSPSPGEACAPQFVSSYAATPANAPSATAPAAGVTPAAPDLTPTPAEAWANPVNLSRSGSASLPSLTANSQGQAFAAWWDQFDGAHYMVNQPGQGWSVRLMAPGIVGAPATKTNQAPTPPTNWRWLASDDGSMHALWLDTTGHLMHIGSASPAAGGPWSAPEQLASGVLEWTAEADGATIQLAYIQSDATGGLPPGIYEQRLTNGNWSAPQALATSPYFRSVPDSTLHLDLAVNGSGAVVVAWDDPQSLSSQFAQSADGGQSFSAPLALSVADPRVQAPARSLRLLPVPGGFLRQWETGSGCSLYQQQLSGTDGTWTAPVRALEQLPGCLTGSRAYPLPDGRLVLWASVSNSNSPENLVLWNGTRWSQALRADFTFVDATSNRPAALSCLQTALSGEQILVLGCDARGDVWFTRSQLGLNGLLPALADEWRPQVSLSEPGTNAGLPAAALDGDVIQALWPQDLPGGLDQQRLEFARGNGQDWTAAGAVLEAQPDGSMNMPVIVADLHGWLQAVWSSGPNGQLFYSRSYLHDAASSQGWSAPVALPAPQASGGWPAMQMAPDGRLIVIETLPFNEDRGVYEIESSDGGQTWSTPRLVFDAAAAGWSTVQGTQLAIDNSGRMHIMVVRGSLPPAATSLGVYYLRSDDGGRTWTPPEPVGDSGAGFPRLVATARGELFRFWVQPASNQQPVWQQASQDGGQSWSPAGLVPGLHDIAPNLGVTSDGQGAIFLVAVAIQPDQSAALVYLRWDGQQWVDQQRFPLGYTADSASGATAILLPSHRLGVFYRVTTSGSPGAGPYLVGYTERIVPGTDLAALPTLTPTPPAPPTATQAPPPTLTAIPTLDANDRSLAATLPNIQWLPIAAILGVMLLTLAVAIWQLTSRRN